MVSLGRLRRGVAQYRDIDGGVSNLLDQLNARIRYVLLAFLSAHIGDDDINGQSLLQLLHRIVSRRRLNHRVIFRLEFRYLKRIVLWLIVNPKDRFRCSCGGSVQRFLSSYWLRRTVPTLVPYFEGQQSDDTIA